MRLDETFDELLARLAVDRTAGDVERLAGFAGEGIEEHMRDARAELNESLDERGERTNDELDQS